MLVFETIVKMSEHLFTNKPEYVENRYGIVFPKVKRVHADRGLDDALKYMANYGFYKFGLEVNTIN